MFSSENWFGASAGFYNGATSTSMRFRRGIGSNTEINRDPSSAGDRKKHTLAFWVKRCKPSDGSQVILGAFASSYSDFAYFRSDDRFEYGVGNAYQVCTDMKFRDVSAWYHIVAHFDVANSTTTSRLRFWVNGVEQTKTITYGSYPADQDYAFSNTVDQTVGGLTHFGGYELDGYLCDLNFIDGSLVPYTSFGEFKNGIWIPIDIDTSAITYGTNGFRMLFNGTDTDGASTSGTVNANSVGASSVNSNHFHAYSTALSNHSALPDNPENNFCTLNTLDKVLTSSALSEGNLSVSAGTGNAWNNIINSTFSLTSGKWYWEVYQNGTGGFGKIGVRQNNSLTSADSHSAGASEVYLFNGNKQQGSTSTDSSYYGSAMYADGNIFGVALDMDAGKIWVAKANTYGGSADPTTGNGAMFTNLTEPQSPSFSSYNMATIFNFGQDHTFAGEKTSGSANANDANGNGEFYYAPPSGFLAICTSNLPESTISPNADTQAVNHFGTLTYTGDGNSTQNIRSGASGIGGEIDFKPDFTWTKGRIVANSHLLYDSSRGAGASKGLKANDTAVEGENDNSTYGYLSSFETNGFNVVKGSTSDYSFMNQNNKTLVAWNWKAGGTTPSKTYKVVVVSDSGNKYRFRNSADDATFSQSAVTLDLQEGGTYTFDYSDSTATSHPFRFSTTSDGTHGSGSEYTTGVVKDDTAKTITITVASSAPTLYYYCSAHSGMGGQVNTNTTIGQTNFDGSVLSVSNANTDAGFSIVTYTSNNSNSTTIGHGLGIKPDIMFQKNRSATSNWLVLHQLADGTLDYHLLDSTSAGGAGVQPVATTSTVATWKSSSADTTGNLMVAYCFASIEGYSKYASYIGGGSNLPFVFTGFRPAWVMTKSIGSGNWYINDTGRYTFNPTGGHLYADLGNVESGTGIDILSNGFKIRNTDASQNTSGQTYIYMAFAEAPFKYANAR